MRKIFLCFTFFLLVNQSSFASQDFISNWKSTTSLNTARSRLGTVVSNNNIYAIGGYYEDQDGGHQRVLSSVEYSTINNDGTLSGWRNSASLPVPIMDGGVTIHNGYIYVAGGTSELNGKGHREVYFASINLDGSLGNWKSTNPMRDTRSFFNLAASKDGKIYAVGGYNGDWTGVFSRVEFATINPDGSLGPWQSTQSLPQDEWGVGLGIINNNLYAIGAYTQSGAASSVYFSKINNDGSLSGWQNTSSLPENVWDAGIAVFKDKIFVIGGANNGGEDGSPTQRSNSQSVYQSEIGQDGNIGQWLASNPIASPSAGIGAAASNGYIYSVGGTTAFSSQTPQSSVQFATKPSINNIELNADATAININGYGFSPTPSENTVYFGNVTVTPTSYSNGVLTVNIPNPPRHGDFNFSWSGSIKVMTNGVSTGEASVIRVIDGLTPCSGAGMSHVSQGSSAYSCIFPDNFSDNRLDILIMQNSARLKTDVTYTNSVRINGEIFIKSGELEINCARPPETGCSTISFSNGSSLTNRAAVINYGTIDNDGEIKSSSANGILNLNTYKNESGGILTLSSAESNGILNGVHDASINGVTGTYDASFVNDGTVNIDGTSGVVGFFNYAGSNVTNNIRGIINIRSNLTNNGTLKNIGTIKQCTGATFTGTSPEDNPISNGTCD